MNPVFFCDRNLGKGFGKKLRQRGLQVELHDDHFPQDTPDEELLREVAARGWILLTLDTRMRRKSAEKAAILQYKVGVILFPTPGRPQGGWLLDLAEDFAKEEVQRKVSRFLGNTPPPFVARFRVEEGKSGKKSGKRYRLERLSLG